MTDDLRTTYNRIAADFAADHQHDSWIEDFLIQFAQALPATASMLDLGCGPAWEMQRMARPGLTQVGSDLSDELLKIAQENNPNATFVRGDMRHLPFEAGSFDGVFAKASLLHIKKDDVPSVLDEISRVLKPNGVVYIGVKKQNPGQSAEATITEHDYGYSYERFYSFWIMPELISLLEQHHFSVFHNEERPNERGDTTWLNIFARHDAV